MFFRRFTGLLLALIPVIGSIVAAEEGVPPAGFRNAMDAVQKAAHAHPDRSPAYFTELERGFRRLQGQYPDQPEIYAELLFVADHTAGESAEALARQILDWPAPGAVKEKVRGVLRKKSALGKTYDLTLATVDGAQVKPSDLRGKVVLLDFWATWCPPCREKLPELKALFAKQQAHGFEIVGLSFDDDLVALKKFIVNERVTWWQIADGKGWDNSARAREFGITSLPTMWLVDKQGRLRDVDAREDLAAKVEKLLAE